MTKEYIVETIKQHQDTVNSVIVSPDEQHLYSVADDGHLHGYWTRSWAFSMSNTHTGIGELTSIAVSPHSELLATGSRNGQVLIWKPSIVGHVRECIGHTGPVTDVVFTPDGKYVLSAGGVGDQSIRKWEVETQKLVVTYHITNHPINALALSTDGQTGLAANGNEITVFQISNGAVIKRIQAHKGTVNDVAVSPDSTVIISGGEDGEINIWSCLTLEFVTGFMGHNKPVKTVAISPDNKYWVCATGTPDSVGDMIYIRESAMSAWIKKLKGHKMSINSLCFTPDGKHLISASTDRRIIVWDFNKIIEDSSQKQAERVEVVDEIPTLQGQEVKTQAKKMELYNKFPKFAEFMQKQDYEGGIAFVKKIKEEAVSLGFNEITDICDNILNSISGVPEMLVKQKIKERRAKLKKRIAKVVKLVAEENFEMARYKAEKIKKRATKQGFTDLVNSADAILKDLEGAPTLEERLLAKAKDLKQKPGEPTEVESLEPITELIIPADKMYYDKSSKRLSFNLPYFTFLGHYPKSTTFKEVLDDMHRSLGDVKLKRKKIYIVDPMREQHIDEDIKIKDLTILDEEERDKKIEREKLANILLDKTLGMGEIPDSFDDKLAQVKEKISQIEKAAEAAEDQEELRKTAEELSYKLSKADSEVQKILKEKYEKRLAEEKAQQKQQIAPPVDIHRGPPKRLDGTSPKPPQPAPPYAGVPSTPSSARKDPKMLAELARLKKIMAGEDVDKKDKKRLKDLPVGTRGGPPPPGGAPRAPGGPPPPGGPPGGPPPTPARPSGVSSLRGEMMGELGTLFKRRKSEKKAPKTKKKAKKGTLFRASDVGHILGGAPEVVSAAATASAGAPPPPTGAAPSSAAPQPVKTEMMESREKYDYVLEEAEEGEDAYEKTYDINMGLQYYSCMMERQSYLFYVYFSHKKLIIEDEEGKVVYETTFQIVTTKEEPPQLDLRVEGKGFEVHPISATVEVDEDADSQSLIIFSIYVKKSKGKSKKEEKEGEKRYLHIYIDFEDKNVSHTILSVLVQPKHFSLDLGPLHISLSKSQAVLLAFVPIMISAISFIYAISQFEFTGGGSIGGMIPGGGTLIFALSFTYTLLKKGVFPLKQKVSGFLDFDKTPAVLK